MIEIAALLAIALCVLWAIWRARQDHKRQEPPRVLFPRGEP